MFYPRRLLPSTSMLMAFEATARTGSFTRAARELNLTQGAVSRQVSALEDQLETKLFERANKSIYITDTGKSYAEDIHAALQMIRNASLNVISNPLGGTLNLAILPTFGTRWLMPKFPSFLSAHPDITVNFATKLSPFDFKDENLHAAIHYGQPDWPDTESTFLMSETVIPVCSPEFLNQHPITSAQALITQPLLHLKTRPNAWNYWCEANQLAQQNDHQGILFEEFSIIAQAAAAGLGIALLPTFLIESELQRKELTIALDKPLINLSGYFLVTPTSKASYPPTRAFKQWLLATIEDNHHSD